MNRMITRLSRLFGVDMGYIMRGGFWLGLDNVVSVVASTILTVVFANTIPKETYGSYRYILSVFGILSIATLPNMNLALSTAVAKGEDGIFKKALATRIRWGLVGGLVGIGLGVYQFAHQHLELGIAFAIMGIILPFMDSLNLYEGFLRGKKLFNIQSRYSIITRLVSTVVLIITLYQTSSVIYLLLAFFLPYIVMRLIFYRLTLRKFPTSDIKGNESTLAYGKHLSVIQLLGVLVNYLDNVLIFHYLGAVPLAIYSIAMAPIKKIQQAFSVIPDLALPKFSARSIEETKRTLPRQIGKAFVVVISGAALYALLAPKIFSTFFAQYKDSVIYSQWLTLILLALPFSLLYTVFQAHARKKEIYIYNLSIRLSQLVLVVALVSTYGLWGAVSARIIFQFIAVIVAVLLFKRIKDTEAKKS